MVMVVRILATLDRIHTRSSSPSPNRGKEVVPSFVGYIRNTKSNNGVSKAGRPWSSYNAEIHTEKGVQKISFGFDKPTVSEGDYVELEANLNKGFMEVDKSTVKRIDPPKAAAVPAGTKAVASDAEFKNRVTSDIVPDYNRQTNPEDARRMTYAAARSASIELAAVLLANDALPTSKAQNKGGSAKRFNEIVAAVDKLTVKYFHDGLTLRLLETVADTQIETAPSSDLPGETPDFPEGNAIDD
jgi:hypothetical protein